MHYGVDPHSVHACLVRGQGGSDVAVRSLATIAGMRLTAFCAAHSMSCDEQYREGIFRRTRDAAVAIIAGVEATCYASGAGLVRTVRAIHREERRVPTASTPVDGDHGIDEECSSVPAVAGEHGIERRLTPEPSIDEVAPLRHSAGVVKERIASVGEQASLRGVPQW